MNFVLEYYKETSKKMKIMKKSNIEVLTCTSWTYSRERRKVNRRKNENKKNNIIVVNFIIVYDYW